MLNEVVYKYFDQKLNDHKSLGLFEKILFASEDFFETYYRKNELSLDYSNSIILKREKNRKKMKNYLKKKIQLI